MAIAEIAQKVPQKAFGFDLGRVAFVREHPNYEFPVRLYHASPFVEWVLPSVWLLVKLLTPERVHIIKNAATKQLAELARSMLQRSRFFEYTGMLESNYHPSKDRVEKRYACETYEITHMVDDRAEVGRFLPRQVEFFWFRPQEVDRQKHGEALRLRERQENFVYHEIDGWVDVLDIFLFNFDPFRVSLALTTANADPKHEEMRRIAYRMFASRPTLKNRYLPF